MTDAKSKIRVERLLRGEFRPDDMAGLFLFARDHCDGREAVADIGHFIAHHQERDRGIVTRLTREWFAVVRFHMARFVPGGPHEMPARQMPSATPDYFKIAARRIGAQTVRSDTGLRLVEAERHLLAVVSRMTQNSDGTWALPPSMAPAEHRIVQCAASYLVAKPAFEEEKLYVEFIDTLKSNGLISKEQIRTNGEDLRRLVGLFAISVMHNCLVQVGDGTTVQLKGLAISEGNRIGIYAEIPTSYGVAWNTEMFHMDTDVNTACESELIDATWDFEIELNPGQRLARLH
jgi:hypothetical protein